MLKHRKPTSQELTRLKKFTFRGMMRKLAMDADPSFDKVRRAVDLLATFDDSDWLELYRVRQAAREKAAAGEAQDTEENMPSNGCEENRNDGIDKLVAEALERAKNPPQPAPAMDAKGFDARFADAGRISRAFSTGLSDAITRTPSPAVGDAAGFASRFPDASRLGRG